MASNDAANAPTTVVQLVTIMRGENITVTSTQYRRKERLWEKFDGHSEEMKQRLLSRCIDTPSVRRSRPASAHIADIFTTHHSPNDLSKLSCHTLCDTMRKAGVYVTKEESRSKAKLLAKLSELSNERQNEVTVQASGQALAKKRKRIDEGDEPEGMGPHSWVTPPRRKRVALDPLTDLVNGPFLKPVAEEAIQRRVADFIQATSNTALRMGICAACARRLNMAMLTQLPLTSIPNQQCLRPTKPHHAHELTNGMLLHDSAVRGESCLMCTDCLRSLHHAATPPLSLANGLWIGKIPLQLELLTLPERVLIARYFPAAYIVKLYPKDRSVRLDQRALNSGLRGNVTTYPLDHKSIAEFINGQHMPPHPSILPATIGVTFVGTKDQPARNLPNLFRVQRQRVREALVWLKENNELYRDIVIDDSRLNELPEDGVPEQLLSTARFSDDAEALEREHSGYVPDEDSIILDAQDVMPIDLAEEDEHDGHTGGLHADVIPLQAHGVVNTSGSNITETELMVAALQNTAMTSFKPSYEEVKIRHGSEFINEYPRLREGTGERFTGGVDSPNHLLGAFPVLFPYGEGGFEVDRPYDVSYAAHVRWALQYEDRRFRKDLQFVFQTFGVMTKREICGAASIQIKKATYRQHATAIAKLTPRDLQKASIEEAQRRPFSNPAVRALREHLSALRSKVRGTDEHRRSIRSKIWGCTVMNGPPSLWLTINPSDMHDPVAQVLCGEEIDLDNFCAKAGPDSTGRAFNIAADPYAAAEFFHYTVRCVLETLLGIKALDLKGRQHIKREEGILGTIKSYIGTVEAQGRGMLHLHLLLWLDGAPTAQLMESALREPAFRQKVRTFIDRNITAHVEGLAAEDISSAPKRSSCSYSRPPDASAVNFKDTCSLRVQELAPSLQLHSCKGRGCQQMYKGRKRCKRRAPFALSEEAWISEAGEWGPRRKNEFMVAWQPTLLVCLRCNHDLKLLTNASNTKNLAWYITVYATKKQHTSSNASALLAQRLAFHVRQEARVVHADALNKRLLQRCANTLSREQEFSAPEVISYLMGWGDRYISNIFVPIYWNAVTYALKAEFPELRSTTHLNQVVGSQASVTDQDIDLTLVWKDGAIGIRDQVSEYTARGDSLSQYSYLDFFINTYQRYGAGDKTRSVRRVENQQGTSSKRARHIRTAGHETLPQFIGAWFPRRDDEKSRAFYCASMLALLKPWRQLSDLKACTQSFEEAFQEFERTMDRETKEIMDNIDYFHQTSDAAEADRQVVLASVEVPEGVASDTGDQDPLLHSEGNTDTHIEDADIEASITEEDIEVARRDLILPNDRIFAKNAMNLAYMYKVFEQSPSSSPLKDHARCATAEQMHMYERWDRHIRQYTRNGEEDWDGINVLKGNEAVHPWGLSEHASPAPGMAPAIHVEATQPDEHPSLPSSLISHLNAAQARGHDIIKRHLLSTLRGSHPRQLLMLVNGCGGTGKSTLIEAVTATFHNLNASDMLAKTATSGVAATRIGGSTVHSWAGVDPCKRDIATQLQSASKRTREKRMRNMQTCEYLFIDEYSMMTKDLLETISQICFHVRSTLDKATGEAFGGLNVVLFGDFHQFPPVANKKGALYSTSDANDTASFGRSLFRQFDVCVTLEKQMRVVDEVWTDVLNKLRVGKCLAHEIGIVERLVLGHKECVMPDFTTEPWAEATLITPRHSVRMAWNDACLRQHCTRSKEFVYVSPAEDVIGQHRSSLSQSERLLVAGTRAKLKARLEDSTELAIGMKAMVVHNVSTESDLSNGSRGVVQGIVLDHREPPTEAINGVIRLRYPPACVFFKLDYATFTPLPGLPPKVIPVFPKEATFTLTDYRGRKKRITRRQLPMTPAYAFTDYKSQGQTLERVIVDLAQPHRNALDQFNAYVALSRSRGRETIRLLRDFDKTLFSTTPPADLEDEDARLEKLAQLTKNAYEGGEFVFM